jgi:hypothetical protein
MVVDPTVIWQISEIENIGARMALLPVITNLVSISTN